MPARCTSSLTSHHPQSRALTTPDEASWTCHYDLQHRASVGVLLVLYTLGLWVKEP